jgi:putative ABC transport system permease protein
VIWRGRALESLDQEIRDHIELDTRENIDRGMSPEEARHAALRKFGNVTMVKEDARAVWFPVWLEQLLQDTRYGLRVLRRNPGFAAVVVLTLALGIGMNTAVFSVVNAVLLRPLSYSNPDRLIWLATTDRIFSEEIVPRFDFWEWRQQETVFERMVAYRSQDLTIATTGNAVQARIALVSHDFWEVSGARPVVGRLPNPGEHDVLLLSHGLFEREFHGDQGVVGRAVTLDGQQVTIVGVLQKTFRFQLVPPPRRGPDSKDIEAYAPLDLAPQDSQRSRGRTVSVVARLKPGVTLDRARAEIETIRSRIATGAPNSYLDQMPLQVQPLRDRLVGHTRAALAMLLGAVAFLLLIACANIANLLLARASSRHREIATRASLGAARGRIVRQFLAESTVLAFLGGAAGVMVAWWSLTTILHLVPNAVPRFAVATIDGPVLGFAVAATIVTTFLFGLAPAISLWKISLVDAMRDGARSVSATSGSLRARKALVAAELSLSVVLLCGAGLLVKSLWNMNRHPPGFHPESILVMKVSGPGYPNLRARVSYVDEVLRRLEGMPGVQAVGITPNYPIRTGLDARGGRQLPPGQSRPQTTLNATSSGYARAMGLRLVAGRWITDSEATPVVVINESLARREFGEENPIGKGLLVQAIWDGRTPMYSPIVGVVADLKDSKLDEDPEPQLYMPYAHVPIGSGITVVIRSAHDPRTAAPTIRRLIADIDKTQAVYDVRTLEEALAESVAPRRFMVILVGTFAAAALLVVLIGVYGVVSYSVEQRTREIGVRLALGARRGEVVRMVVLQGMQFALVGIVAGLASAVSLTRLMVSLLYEVEPGDPQTFAIVVALLLTTALVACCGPAARAATVDPIVALRQE